MAKTIKGPTAPSSSSAPNGASQKPRASAPPDVGDTLVDMPRPVASDSPPACLRAPADDPLLGTVLGGKYRLLRPLAEGGMGMVYEARHVNLKRSFAVKVLSLESEKQEDAVPRFKREAELASAIGHENIIDVVDIDTTEDGRWYIVMELLEGEELRQRMFRAKRLPLDEAVPIARQLGAALDAAHAHGVVHRDFKPENVYLLRREDGSDMVKVLDFGISKVRDADVGLTRPGEVLGTPYYMAPEQARGDRTIDHRADLFAFGAVLYEALTGEEPFSGDTPNAILHSILLDSPPVPQTINPDLSDAVGAVIMRALEKDPADRYQSGSALCDALARAVERQDEPDEPAAPPRSETPTEPPPPVAARAPAQPKSGYGAKHLIIAFVLGAILCAGALLLMRMSG